MPHAVTTKDLDVLDRRIIDQLQDDGRRSNVAIARALGVTEATIRNRIDRLVSNGFIRIAAVIDPRKTPYLTDAMIWIRLERGRAREAGEHLASLPNVVYVAYTAGRYDMLIEALFESDDQLFEFLHGTLSKVRGVLQSETYHVLHTVKINYDWKLPLDPAPPEPPPGRSARWRSRSPEPPAPVRSRRPPVGPAPLLAGADGRRMVKTARVASPGSPRPPAAGPRVPAGAPSRSPAR
jgi:Lrp/AsnC family transcriptional regulator for asnA, asnC and gidA